MNYSSSLSRASIMDQAAYGCTTTKLELAQNYKNVIRLKRSIWHLQVAEHFNQYSNSVSETSAGIGGLYLTLSKT